MGIALFTLALMGTLGFLATIGLGYGFAAGAVPFAKHFAFAFLSTMLLVMAHSFIMFFLIATGVELKNMEKERGWGDSFRRRTVAMKGHVFPPATLALLLVIAQFVLGGAAHTHRMPVWIHHGLAWATLATCVLALAREYVALGETNRLIEEAGRRQAAQ